MGRQIYQFDTTLSIFNLFCLLCFLSRVTAQVHPEKLILLQFKTSVSDPSGLLSTWNSAHNSSHCTWFGVKCDSQSRVLELNIPGNGGNHIYIPSSCFDNNAGFTLHAFGIRRTCSHTHGELIGKLSHVLGNLTQLRVLSLPFHRFYGEIPNQVWGLKNLQVLDLEGNLLSGDIPVEFTGLRKLRLLNLAFNKIVGEIPGSLLKCRDLEVMNLNGNQLEGSIPRFLGNYRNLKGLYLSSNRFVGFVPYELMINCLNLQHLDLSGNFLSGKLLRSLGNCGRLRTIMFFSNQFVGVIPREIGQLRRLEVLDLSQNNLSGPIPVDLCHIRNLKYLSLAGNNLTEPIPSMFAQLHSLKFQDMSLSSSLNVRRLMWQSAEHLSIAPGELPADQDQKPDKQDSSPPSATKGEGMSRAENAIVISASAIFAVVLIMGTFYFYTRKQRQNSHSPPRVSEPQDQKEIQGFIDVGVPLTLDTVVQATGNFSSSNCIGNGGFGATYKAEVSPGTTLAIKRLTISRCQGVRQFDAEVRSLRMVKHDNLITLIGYYASKAEMFLIYNYLPGGNLEEFIQRPTRVIIWKVLHKIALDIASALYYLHTQCHPRIIHRDIKPSNILLDGDLNAYLSDFGLSRLLGDAETHATTGVAGTFGYVAPEYALTCRVTEKADVYSYGVVILELISDKKALDPSFSVHANGFTIVTWATMLVTEGREKEVFTEGLWDAGPQDALMELLHLAIRCTSEALVSRPNMRQVVHRLKQIEPEEG